MEERKCADRQVMGLVELQSPRGPGRTAGNRPDHCYVARPIRLVRQRIPTPQLGGRACRRANRASYSVAPGTGYPKSERRKAEGSSASWTPKLARPNAGRDASGESRRCRQHLATSRSSDRQRLSICDCCGGSCTPPRKRIRRRFANDFSVHLREASQMRKPEFERNTGHTRIGGGVIEAVVGRHQPPFSDETHRGSATTDFEGLLQASCTYSSDLT